ncbi:UNVERIFIED_CONTAM: putative pentatricopeptide repeat-containing protein, mitochondrial [Sesamum latifolium]|uniref:Pentatricopeptide repeat-containing protein, mitochondrial n=1 Tax=Sesamum latifolium TaxID=2727402 RepID=A0AAW2XUP0_9LAMI
MGGMTAASAVHLIRRGISANKLGTSSLPFSFFSSNFHSIDHKDGTFSLRPRIDFSCIHEIDDAVFLFREMVRMRPQPSVVQFNKLLSIIVKMKQYRVALNLFDEMRQSDIPVSEYKMNIAINCYCLLNRVDFGFAILGSFFKRGYEPNVTTFTTLIKGLFLDDKLIEAEKLFKKLLTLKMCETDEVTILTVINGLCKAGHTLTAYDLLGLFEKTSFKPNVYSYNTVIDSLCKDRMVDEALQLLAKMIDKGISPNIVTYNSVVQGFCNFGRWKEAKDLISEMVDHKIFLNRNISPDVVMYTTLIDGYRLVGQIDKARKLLDSMPGRCADGLKLFKDMHAQQLIPDVVTYNTLLNGLCMNKQIVEAFSFLDIMEEQDVNPDLITYSILIHGLCKDGKLEIARNLFNSLPSKGLQPNAQMYTSIIGSLCQEGHIEDAKCLLVEMEKSGCAPDSVTYNVCIQGLLKRKLLVEAKTFLDEMYRRGFSSDATSASMLLDHLQDEGLR